MRKDFYDYDYLSRSLNECSNKRFKEDVSKEEAIDNIEQFFYEKVETPIVRNFEKYGLIYEEDLSCFYEINDKTFSNSPSITIECYKKGFNQKSSFLKVYYKNNKLVWCFEPSLCQKVEASSKDMLRSMGEHCSLYKALVDVLTDKTLEIGYLEDFFKKCIDYNERFGRY